MPHQIPWSTSVQDHPGSSEHDIQAEGDWKATSQHRVGVKGRQGRRAGVTHQGDEHFDNGGTGGAADPNGEVSQQRLTNFRDVAEKQRSQQVNKQELPLGWRQVFDCSEEDIKYQEPWPANRRQQQEGHDRADNTKADNGKQNDATPADQSREEHDWRGKNGEKGTHNEAYGTCQPSKEDDLLDKYTPQQIALLRALQHESTYRQNLQENDGHRASPQQHHQRSISIDEKDQFTPDNWLPRSSGLIRLTGSHPMNAEPDLSDLYDAGLITPNDIHYIRNHGAVPRLTWDSHKLDVENGKLVLSMDDLKSRFDSLNFPVSLACDGNRRKEVNLVRKSKGFGWGAGGTGCAYWKGVLLRDVLAVAGVTEKQCTTKDGLPRWVNFEGCDEPSEGKYATCIPLRYAMDSTSDVLLAYEMNDRPIPPDHGYPLRLIIPGYVGGRCVKWLGRIWTSDEENSSHYHIWDNRVLPPFVTDKDGPFAKTMFAHPDSACNEQNLNSVIVKPAQKEKLSMNAAQKGQTYRIEGYAYDGGGHEVQRVEVSLDGGETWLYCIRRLPEYPVRHGNKFWTWLHWHVDVSVVHLLQAKKLHVRAFNVFKNTQPQNLAWNIMGMMNNCWYTVTAEVQQDDDDAGPSVLFRHPCEPTGDGGWMKPSVENQIEAVKQKAGTPQKQFTREEIEKHDKEGDCWIVVDGTVYDATSVLSWHPGGKAAVLTHAGKVHQQTSEEFSSIHDGYAYQKLKECALGVVTEKTAKYIKAQAEAEAKENANSSKGDRHILLQKHCWVPVTLEKRTRISEDTRQYTFRIPNSAKTLGLGTCQHIQLGFHLQDRMLIRDYTPIKPLIPTTPSHNVSQIPNAEAAALEDGQGTFDLAIKTYFPTSQTPGGAMTNFLDLMQVGEQVDVRGPTGEIIYNGEGKFSIEGVQCTFTKISLVLGGSGITPGYALIARIAAMRDAAVQVRVVDANKSEADILLYDELARLEKESQGRLKITHVLSHPTETWRGSRGHVNEKIIQDSLFAPGEDSVAFMCGPPTMIQKAALPALKGKSVPHPRARGEVVTLTQIGGMLRRPMCLASRTNACPFRFRSILCELAHELRVGLYAMI